MPAAPSPAFAAPVRAAVPARKRGPKPKRDGERRTHQANCRLTDDEWLELQRRRGALAPAEALRVLALSRTLPRSIPQINLHAYGALARAAGNLNQLARRANATDQLDLAELAATLGVFRAALLGVSGEYEEELKAQFEPDLDDMPSGTKGAA